LRFALEVLIDIQEIDKQLMLLEKAKGNLPQKVKEISSQLKHMETELDEKRNLVEEATSKLKKAENDLALSKKKLQKYQQQLYQVKTNKEYDAVTVEIDSAEQEIDKLEFQILEAEEISNNTQKEIAELEKNVQTTRADLEENKKMLDNTLDETRHAAEKLNKRRNELLKNLSKPIISTYDRIRIGRHGIALALLKNGSCSECSARIPPQRGMEIRMMNRLFYCEVCGRILIWKEEEDSPTVQNEKNT
jgi:predicted  nucleic acid-binding Zn-ribbon protein